MHGNIFVIVTFGFSLLMGNFFLYINIVLFKLEINHFRLILLLQFWGFTAKAIVLMSLFQFGFSLSSSHRKIFSNNQATNGGGVQGLSRETGCRIMMGLRCTLVMLSSNELMCKVVLCVKGISLINVNTQTISQFGRFCLGIEERQKMEVAQTSADRTLLVCSWKQRAEIWAKGRLLGLGRHLGSWVSTSTAHGVILQLEALLVSGLSFWDSNFLGLSCSLSIGIFAPQSVFYGSAASALLGSLSQIRISGLTVDLLNWSLHFNKWSKCKIKPWGIYSEKNDCRGAMLSLPASRPRWKGKS